MSFKEDTWVSKWRAYLDGFPPEGWPTDSLENDLALITAKKLSGAAHDQEAYAEVGRMIAEKLKERGEASCLTTPFDANTPR